MVKFYITEPSPPCRLVAMTLAELGSVEFEKIPISFINGDQKKPEYLKINPVGKVPAIVDGDFTVTQSVAIAKYLCNAYGATSSNKKLYPNDLRVRTKVDEMCFLAQDFRESFFGYANMQGILRGTDTEPNGKHLENSKAGLNAFENILSQHDYVAGNYLTIADFQVLTVVEFMHLAKFNEWGDYPNILKWEKRLAALPYYEEAYKNGFDQLKGFYQKRVKENEAAKKS